MAGVKISALPASPGLDGTEIVPIVDAGVTRRTTVGAIISTVDLSAYERESISLTATGTDDTLFLVTTGEFTPIVLNTLGDNANIALSATGVDSEINIESTGTGGTVGVSADSRVSLAAGGDFVISVEFDVVPKLSFFDENAVAQQTGVAVTVEAIHAALVAYGLITA